MSELTKIEYGYAERPKRPERISEDYLLIDEEQMLFGVFDGMGGQGGNPAAAAEAGAEAVREWFKTQSGYETEEDCKEVLTGALRSARVLVNQKGQRGSAVATFMKLHRIDDKPVALVGHAGDTRMFALDQKGLYKPITQDQSNGNTVFNGLIYGDPFSNELDQRLVLGLSGIKRIMICSDGITGDWPEQKLTDSEFIGAFTQPTVQESADEFMRVSKKPDDKAVVVIDL